MLQLEAREVTDAAGLERYERLNRESPAGSVFSAASWARYQKVPHRVIGVYKGRELVGGCLLYEVDGGLPAVVPATPWQGPVCRPDGEGERLAVAECLAQYLLRRYKDVTLTLHPDWTDIRGFLWAGMRCHVRYTYRGMGREMRGNYEKRLRLNPADSWRSLGIHAGDGWQHFRVALHDTSVDFLEDWWGRYYWQANQGGSWHAEVIDLYLGERGFDLVGCNSPKRGLFKRQFGGRLMPYYVVTTLDPKAIPEFWAPKPAEAAVA